MAAPMVVPPALAAAAYAASLIIACSVGFQKTTTEAPPLAQQLVIAPGVSMPLLANGISRNHSVWLASGGRHIDTAFWYGDVQQAAVGEAIAASGVPRGELFITTKVACCPTERCSSFCDVPPNPVGASTTNVTEQLEHSLGLLGLQQADLVLLHNPCSRPEDTATAYAAIEAALARGLCRAIGVSNLNASALAALLAVAKVPPAVNQCALSIGGHPAAHDGAGTTCLEGSRRYGSDDETVRFSARHGVAFAAYSPLGSISRVDVLGHSELKAVARAKEKTAAQVALRWLVQQGIAAVTATSSADHAAEALDVFSFALTGGEMRRLSRIR